jgi:hypothetical protein
VSVDSSAAKPSPASAMPSVSFRFCTAKVAGEGEDADPILRVGPDLGLLGVFDGMGGAGGRVYDTPEAVTPAPGSPPGSPATWSSG